MLGQRQPRRHRHHYAGVESHAPFRRFKSSPSPPPAPDPAATAAAQTGSNIGTAVAQATLNDVNSNTPYGSTTYNQSGTYSYTDPTNGQTYAIPQFTQNTNLSPLGQTLLQGQGQVATSLIPTAENLATQAGASATTPLNFSGANEDYLQAGPQLLNQGATNALYNQQASFLNPQWDQQQTQLQDQLARQGISVGSDAYNNAETQFNNAKTQAYQSAADSAIGGGSAAAGNLFNMALAGQNQNIAQQETAQSNPMSLLSQIMGTSPSIPSQPITSPTQTGISPTDVLGAQALGTNTAEQNYQAQLQSANATNGGAASALGTIAMLAMMA